MGQLFLKALCENHHPTFMKLIKKCVVVGVSACIYYLSLLINEWIWGDPGFSFDVHWVFFPSGIRFVLVLLALESGALGIALGGILWIYQDHPDLGLHFALITGCLAGLSPLLARQISVIFLGLDREFKVVSPMTLMKISLLFATLSALLHQIWFYALGLTESLPSSFCVMALSNWAGTLLVLMAFKFLVQRPPGPSVDRQNF
jgi:hypothetical protein